MCARAVAGDDGQLGRGFRLKSCNRFMFAWWQRTWRSTTSSEASCLQVIVSRWCTAVTYGWRPTLDGRCRLLGLVSATAVSRRSNHGLDFRLARTTRRRRLLSSGGGCGGVNRRPLLGSSLRRETSCRSDATLAYSSSKFQSTDAGVNLRSSNDGQSSQQRAGRVAVARSDQAGWTERRQSANRDTWQISVGVISGRPASGPVTCV